MAKRRAVPGVVDAVRERVLPRDGWRARLARDQLHAALKAVVATSVAWELGRLIGPAPVVYFAPITALVAIHPTIARSLRETLFYAASVVAGVLLAMGADAWAGTSLLGILLVVGVGVLLGAAQPFGRNGSNIAFWALLVLLVGGSSPASYLSERLPEAALGLGVGVLVNVTVLPRTRLRPAGRLLDWLRTDLADVADAMAADLAQDWPPADPWWAGRDDELEQATQQARGAVGAATDSMRFNPRSRRRGRRPMERREHEVLEGLERIATAMRAIVRTLTAAAGGDDASAGLDQAFRKTYGGLLARLATPIREHGTGSRARGRRARPPRTRGCRGPRPRRPGAVLALRGAAAARARPDALGPDPRGPRGQPPAVRGHGGPGGGLLVQGDERLGPDLVHRGVAAQGEREVAVGEKRAQDAVDPFLLRRRPAGTAVPSVLCGRSAARRAGFCWSWTSPRRS